MTVIVVGGGVIGLLTAVECVRAGARVELLDRAGIPSASATSSDLYRVVHALHRGDRRLTLAAARAQQAWLKIERMLNARFYHRTGVLTTVEPGHVAADLALTAAAGAVLASRALEALAGWLRAQHVVRLRRYSQVVAIDGPGIVRLADGTVLSGDRVVAAGPWSRELLPVALSGNLVLYRQTNAVAPDRPGSYRPITSNSFNPAAGRPHDGQLVPAPAATSASSATTPASPKEEAP